MKNLEEYILGINAELEVIQSEVDHAASRQHYNGRSDGESDREFWNDLNENVPRIGRVDDS